MTTQPDTKTYSRSISQLKSWTKCGEAFYLERFRRADLPVRPAPWTIMGVAVHDAIMEWEKSHRQIDISVLYYELYDRGVEEAWEKQPDEKYWFLPPMAKYVSNSITNYRARGAEQLEVYIQEVEYAPWEIDHIERQFEIDFDGVLVRGAVDRVLYFPGMDSYLVEDLKTGTAKEEEDYRQLGLYAYVARTLWDIPVTTGRYWFTKLNRPSPEYDLSRFDKNFWTQTFKDLDAAISYGVFLPSPGSGCQLCAVRPWCSTQGWLEIGEDL